jgi:hypothetical protein
MDEWLSAPAAYPEARRAIGALDPTVREEMHRALEPIDLHAGDTLFAPATRVMPPSSSWAGASR